MTPSSDVFASRKVNAAGIVPSANKRLPTPREAARGNLLRVVRSLHNAIKCEEREDDAFSHGFNTSQGIYVISQAGS